MGPERTSVRLAAAACDAALFAFDTLCAGSQPIGVPTCGFKPFSRRHRCMQWSNAGSGNGRTHRCGGCLVELAGSAPLAVGKRGAISIAPRPGLEVAQQESAFIVQADLRLAQPRSRQEAATR